MKTHGWWGVLACVAVTLLTGGCGGGTSQGDTDGGGSGGLFPPGVDSSAKPLATGATDPHYTLSSNDPSFPGPDAIVVGQEGPNWVPPDASSMWISIQPSAQSGGHTYTYTTTFTVSGDPTAASISGMLACDDLCTVSLNGTQVVSVPSPAWHTKTTLSIPAGSPFQSGSNTLSFAVTNLGNVTGLEVFKIALSD
jgi:hypothetical protein